MKKGVSPLISFVLTILLVSAATTITLTVIKPTFDRMSDSSVINEATQNLELINSAITQVVSESQGSKRIISLTVSDGEYGIDAAKDFIYCNYTTKTDFSPQGISGNVRLDKSPVFIEYFNSYVENTNASPPWTIKNGTWAIESGEYSGQNGLAYYNYGTTNYFSLEGRITHKSGTNGEIFALPVSPNDLRLYLTFDEGSGNYTYDYSGFNNTGEIINSTAINWTSGKYESGLYFDGTTNSWVNVTPAALNQRENFTVGYWMLTSDSAKSGTAIHGTNTGGNDFIVFNYKSIAIYIKDSLWATGVALNDNSWHYVTVTRDSNVVKFYVDGVLRDTNSSMPTGALTIKCLVLGQEEDAVCGGFDASQAFLGKIDEVKIYNRSLSADEVKADYELGIKKLSSTGRTDTINQNTNVYLVLANPNGNTHFDEVKIKTNKRSMMLSIPYLNADLNGTARIPKGNYQLTIENKGSNTTVNKPIIELTIA